MSSGAHRSPPSVSEPPAIGTLVRLRVPAMGNPVGSLAVVYEVYGDGDRPRGGSWGASLMCANGRYCGWNQAEWHTVEAAGFCPEVADYHFRDVGRLARDWEDGIFAPAFTHEPSYAGPPAPGAGLPAL